MPPPNQATGNKPNDLKRSDFPCNPNWKDDSAGRHHIFLFDGTWNDDTGMNPADFRWDAARHLWVSQSDPTQAFPPIVTNLVKTYTALGPDSDRQVTHYFRGIGNDDENDALNQRTEGALATMEQHIRNAAYCEFLRTYRRGDQISILGFSRGAASARLFARDLATIGFLKEVTIESRYCRVRNSGEIRHDVWTLETKWAGRPLVAGKDLPIAFLGVWDTVATSIAAKPSDWRVPDTVARAVHCLALDETRKLFAPTLLQYPKSRAAEMKEVWFPGAHSDVGGGYYNDALSRVTLNFMWNNWETALAAEGLPALTWRLDLAGQYTATDGLPWMRHQETGLTADLGGVEPRDLEPLNGGLPRVHPSVERFVQQGGLQYCVEGKDFPPSCQVSPQVYSPLAYPGPDLVVLYESTAWA